MHTLGLHNTQVVVHNVHYIYKVYHIHVHAYNIYIYLVYSLLL